MGQMNRKDFEYHVLLVQDITSGRHEYADLDAPGRAVEKTRQTPVTTVSCQDWCVRLYPIRILVPSEGINDDLEPNNKVPPPINCPTPPSPTTPTQTLSPPPTPPHTFSLSLLWSSQWLSLERQAGVKTIYCPRWASAMNPGCVFVVLTHFF